MLGGVLNQEDWLHLRPLKPTERCHESPSFVLPDTSEISLSASLAFGFPAVLEPRNSIACSDMPQNRRSYIISCVPHSPSIALVSIICLILNVLSVLFVHRRRYQLHYSSKSLTVTISALSQDQECNFATGLHVWTGARRSSVLSHTILLLHRPYLHDLPSQHKILISRRRDFSSL